jgi:hypothetical protein
LLLNSTGCSQEISTRVTPRVAGSSFCQSPMNWSGVAVAEAAVTPPWEAAMGEAKTMTAKTAATTNARSNRETFRLSATPAR